MHKQETPRTQSCTRTHAHTNTHTHNTHTGCESSCNEWSVFSGLCGSTHGHSNKMHPQDAKAHVSSGVPLRAEAEQRAAWLSRSWRGVLIVCCSGACGSRPSPWCVQWVEEAWSCLLLCALWMRIRCLLWLGCMWEQALTMVGEARFVQFCICVQYGWEQAACFGGHAMMDENKCCSDRCMQ
jgi:hypothetical protein